MESRSSLLYKLKVVFSSLDELEMASTRFRSDFEILRLDFLVGKKYEEVDHKL